MDKVYFFVSHLDEFTTDGWGFYSRYFVEGSGFLNSFLISLAIAAFMLIVFYGFICNKVFKLSNHITWLVFLICSVGITFFATSHFILGNHEGAPEDYTGFYGSLETTFLQISNQDGFQENPESVENLTMAKGEIIEGLKIGKSEVASSLCTGNSIFTLIWFFLFSVLVKGFTRYGIAIPFVWPRKLHKSI
jgi:hypothetical protein